MSGSQARPPIPPDDLADLRAVSAAIGKDPMLIQAAGGNTSVKAGEVMWIKASGTILADAMARDIFVPCDLTAMRAALASGLARADQPQEFALMQGGLRPSIETSLHAVFAQRVVIHVHCIHTLCHAVQADPMAAIGARLADFAWGFVPYVKPGANLAADVAGLVADGRICVVILGNHGLIVAGETVAQAHDLLMRVHRALALDPRPLQGRAFDLPDGWRQAPESLSAIAQDPACVDWAVGGALYPDHVIFCGLGPRAVSRASDLPDPQDPDCPPVMIVKGAGAVLRADASAGAYALAQCLGDVILRLPEGAQLSYLTDPQVMELLDWDAEKYRQALNA